MAPLSHFFAVLCFGRWRELSNGVFGCCGVLLVPVGMVVPSALGLSLQHEVVKGSDGNRPRLPDPPCV